MAKKRTRELPSLSPTTIGDSPACINIIGMMNKNEHDISIVDKHKILSLITKFLNHLTSLKVAKNNTQYFIYFLKKDYYSKIDVLDIHLNYKTHMKNIITYYTRKHL